MRRRLALGLCATLTSPLPLLAQDTVSEERIAAFVAALEANGCSMTEETAGTLMPAAGFTDRSETRDIVDILTERGVTARDGDALVLTDCAAASQDDLLFRKIMGRYGCQMAFETAVEVFPAFGMDMSTAETIAEAFVDAGQAEIRETDETLILSDEICTPS